MPNPDYSNKPASNLLAHRLKVKTSQSYSGESSPSSKTQQLANKELKHSESNSGSSSSPQPNQIQSSGEGSKQASYSPKIERSDTFEKSDTNNYSLGTVDTFLPVVEIQVNSETNNMSSDEESPKAKRASRRSSAEGSKKKKKGTRRRSDDEGDERRKEKSTSFHDENGEDNEEKVNGEHGRRSKMKKARDVSFSGSTIKRSESKQASQSSLGDSTESLQSALKKTSKYGRSSSGGNSTDDEARPKISFGGAAAAVTAFPPQALDPATVEKRKAMFQRAAGGGSKKNLEDPPAETTPTLNRRCSDPFGDRSDESFLRPEPLQRRSSAPNLVKRKSISASSFDSKGSGPVANLKSRKSVLVGGSMEQMRRSAMSADDQIYVPPKSRHHSVFQAWGHVMAGRVTELVLWTYGASFAKVMLFFLGFYVTNIFLWAFAIMASDTLSLNGHSCLYGSDEYSSAAARYEMAFELSWCTFTTVGYGAISPPGDDWGCYPLRLVCALVAFIGVLFGSTTAAIMYSKLMRLLAQAQVTFSSCLCVQYGKGNEGSTVRFGQLNFRASVAAVKLNAMDLLLNDDDDEKGGSSEEGYPVIEFRMVNDRANRESSEIWDAQISGVVQLLKEEQPKDGNSSNASSRDLSAKAEGGESTLDLEKVVYYPVKLDPDSHPHFSRIWYARHVLNAESPLLKREFRDMIAQDGKWDPDFNTWQEIRDCLNPFISLRITLSGTSAVSAASVYSEHVYEFDDVCVGWRFANMVYEDSYKPFNVWWNKLWDKGDESKTKRPDLTTKVDIKLLHDIVPQPGGDHEPLGDELHSGLDHSMRKFKFW